MSDAGNEEALFGRLRRLVASVRTAHQHDRRNLLSLEVDMRTLHGELSRRCAVLTEQMKDAGTRTAAISAYARTGSLARGLPHARPKQPTE
ncbi:hypothetical protein BH11PSE4_BH11PSE4_24870 [soil metagenome]